MKAMSDPMAPERDPVLASAHLLDELADLATRATTLRAGWTALTPAQRRDAIGAISMAAQRVRTLADHLDPTVVPPAPDPPDTQPTVVPDPVTAVPDAPSGDAPLGEDVFDRVLGIVAAAGGLSEVLAYLIEEVRPHRVPIEEAIAAFRLDRTRGPYAERAVQLLEAALRTGLFH
jgi:hypothetical protein